MKTDREFNVLIIKFLFCNSNTEYNVYRNALVQSESIKNIIKHAVDKASRSNNRIGGISLALDNITSSISNDDPDVLDIYINTIHPIKYISQIMVPVRLDDINNQPKYALLFPSEREIRL